MNPTDGELLEAWRRGDDGAGEQLFERYYGKINRFFVNKVPESAIRDLVQDTFAACVAGRDRLKGEFGAYLYRIAQNKVYDYYRRESRRGTTVDFSAVSVEELGGGPRSLLLDRREKRLLLEALRNIPLEYQVVLEFHLWEGLTTAAIAEILDIPKGTVQSRLRRSRELLEEKMADLAASPQELESTLTRFEDWAEQCRHALGERSRNDDGDD